MFSVELLCLLSRIPDKYAFLSLAVLCAKLCELCDVASTQTSCVILLLIPLTVFALSTKFGKFRLCVFSVWGAGDEMY